MKPVVAVLQLDTEFPRIAGDVGCRETYTEHIEILKISGASVNQIVSSDPAGIAIAPFEDAMRTAVADIIVTSCGFLSYWQTHLASHTRKPFISSALTALPALCQTYAPRDILTVTFDERKLNKNHFGPFRTEVIGLPEDMHLRQVISQNLSEFDVVRVSQEIVDFVVSKQQVHHKHLLLECTNLPPYKAALAAQTGLPITDILSLIEKVRSGTVRPEFL
jgi:hypothetical protein